MSVRMDEALRQMKLSQLADNCTNEMKRHRRREPTEDRYCLEIFRRAILERLDAAWSVLPQCFGEVMRVWLHSSPHKDVALRRDTEENYIAQTFSRFWYAVQNQHIQFATLNSALSYLHATLNGIIMDTLRSHLRSQEVPLPEPGSPEEPVTEEAHDARLLWATLENFLPEERERRLAYLLYYCGLKPREIVVSCPQEFADVKEIYRLNHNIIDRLRRNQDRLRWLLGDWKV